MQVWTQSPLMSEQRETCKKGDIEMTRKMNDVVALIAEYVSNDDADAAEENYIAVVNAMEEFDIHQLKPTSPEARLIISTHWYLEVEPGDASRLHYREMEDEVALMAELA
jgi:hypothetical protein